VSFELGRASVAIGDVTLFSQGRPHDERAPAAAEVLRRPDVKITLNLGAGGSQEATMWTCDLSAEYVKINAEYRT
jgi:glutamate N-acetyltransferase/amino-acid N-acetyltransferase